MNTYSVQLQMVDWEIYPDEMPVIGFAGENDVCQFEVLGDIIDTAEYYLEIKAKRKSPNYVALNKDADRVSVLLTAEMLGAEGEKEFQIRANDDGQIRKSNTFKVVVRHSINAAEYVSDHYPTILDQIEEDIKDLEENKVDNDMLKTDWYFVDNYKANNYYPTKAGKIFGGWYTDETLSEIYTESTGKAYAHFIDQNVFRVGMQYAKSTNQIRFVSTMDKTYTDIDSIGFNLYVIMGETIINQYFDGTLYLRVSGLSLDMWSPESAVFVTYRLQNVDTNQPFVMTGDVRFVTGDGTTVTANIGNTYCGFEGDDLVTLNPAKFPEKVQQEIADRIVGDIETKQYADTLSTSLGNGLDVEVNQSTYEMTVKLMHGDTVLSSSTVDLPLEEMIVDIDYDPQTKEIIFYLKSGAERRVPISDIISGLTHIEQVDALPASDIDDNAIYVLKQGASYDWVDIVNGVPEDVNGYHLKFNNDLPEGVNVVNVQKSASNIAGIYITFPAGITSATINGEDVVFSAIQGAGLYAYLSTLTKSINEIVVNYAPSNSATILIQNNNEVYTNQYNVSLSDSTSVLCDLSMIGSREKYDDFVVTEGSSDSSMSDWMEGLELGQREIFISYLYDSVNQVWKHIDMSNLSSPEYCAIRKAYRTPIAIGNVNLTYQLTKTIEQVAPTESTYHTYIHQDNKWLCLDEDIDLSNYVQNNDRPTFKGVYVNTEPLETTGGLIVGGEANTTIAGGDTYIVGGGQLEVTKKTIFGGDEEIVVGNNNNVTFAGASGNVTFTKPVTFTKSMTVNGNGNVFNGAVGFNSATEFRSNVTLQDIYVSNMKFTSGGTHQIGFSQFTNTNNNILGLTGGGSYNSNAYAAFIGANNTVNKVTNGIIVGASNNLSQNADYTGTHIFGDVNTILSGGIFNGIWGNNNAINVAGGNHNHIIGNDNILSGNVYKSFNYVLGNSNYVTGDNNFVMGVSNSGFCPSYDSQYNFVIGYTNNLGSTASRGNYVFGSYNTLIGSVYRTMTLGYNNQISAGAFSCYAFGENNKITSAYDMAFGSGIVLNGRNDMGFGSTITDNGSYNVNFGSAITNFSLAQWIINFGSAITNASYVNYDVNFGSNIYNSSYASYNYNFGGAISNSSYASGNVNFGNGIYNRYYASRNVNFGNVIYNYSKAFYNVCFGNNITNYSSVSYNCLFGAYLTASSSATYNTTFGSYISLFSNAHNNVVFGGHCTVAAYCGGNVLLGSGLSALYSNQIIIGQNNIQDSSAQFVIGNGSDSDAGRKNIFTIDISGIAKASGFSGYYGCFTNLTLGSNSVNSFEDMVLYMPASTLVSQIGSQASIFSSYLAPVMLPNWLSAGYSLGGLAYDLDSYMLPSWLSVGVTTQELASLISPYLPAPSIDWATELHSYIGYSYNDGKTYLTTGVSNGIVGLWSSGLVLQGSGISQWTDVGKYVDYIRLRDANNTIVQASTFSDIFTQNTSYFDARIMSNYMSSTMSFGNVTLYSNGNLDTDLRGIKNWLTADFSSASNLKSQIEDMIGATIPSFSSADEGKILQIVDGQLSFVDKATIVNGVLYL